MNETEIHGAITQMAQQIYEEVEDRDRLLVLGVRSKGTVLAQRLVEQLQKQIHRNIEVGEVRVFGAGEGLERIEIKEPTSAALEVKDREVVLVDDVIHTGRTAKAALSLIFKLGRPQSVRLAVLVDRGHREVPIKPNYVGKPIPSSEQERVRVKLRETEPGERDKVVIYSILQPPSSDEKGVSA